MNEQHISEPGLVVVEVVAGTEATAKRAISEISQLWASSGASKVWRVPGEPGVRVNAYADIRRRAEDEEGLL
ncbi:DUF6207 family protein [Streptomyces mesophilus]|uniref:DUF6207 family protein n=1 Tax=Streptomyces mesophilus TaxID=1775132 RepID=UPI001F2DC338|nr:DUF6207 family protein [Streptomyces mesophilus]